MNENVQLRPATASDAFDIATFIAESSGGVATIEWELEPKKPGNVSPIDIGTLIYRREDGNYSYRNCVIAEVENHVAGMMLTFAQPDAPARDPSKRPNNTDKNVFAPYMYLEQPNSWYICGVAIHSVYRNRGIGSKLMAVAEEQAKDKGFKALSLVAFEQNTGSVRLYERLGYVITDRAPVIPHPSIHYTGDAVLMVKRLYV